MPQQNKPIPEEPGNIACDICLTEIPDSVAHSQEGDEYALHYCGLECYVEWKKLALTLRSE